MIMKKVTWREAMLFIAIMGFLFTGNLAGADATDAVAALQKAKSISGFVQSIAKDSTKTVPLICSDKMVGKTEGQDPQNRSLGQALINTLQSRESLSLQDLSTRANETLELRDWALKKAGYGNLLIAYAAEAAATRLLFRSLAATNSDVTRIEGFVKRLQDDTPASAYWLEVLNTEEILNPLSPDELKKVEEERKPLLFGKLANKSTAVGDELAFPATDIRSCYQHRNFSGVAFIAVVQQQEVAALQACIQVKRKGSILPADEAAFRAIIKKSASNILNDKTRLAGTLTSGQVWRLWQQYTAPDSKP